MPTKAVKRAAASKVALANGNRPLRSRQSQGYEAHRKRRRGRREREEVRCFTVHLELTRADLPTEWCSSRRLVPSLPDP